MVYAIGFSGVKVYQLYDNWNTTLLRKRTCGACDKYIEDV